MIEGIEVDGQEHGANREQLQAMMAAGLIDPARVGYRARPGVHLDDITGFIAGHPELWCCDFCLGTPVAWSFPARPHRTVLGLGVSESADAAWAACETCTGLLVAGRRREMLDRCVGAHDRLGMIDLADLYAARRAIRAMLDNFWSNREGPPRRLADTITEDR